MTDWLIALIAVCSAGAGALSTFVMARIDRAMMMRRIDKLAQQRERDRAQLIFALTMLGDIANKNGMPERFSTGILRALCFTPTEGSDDRLDADSTTGIERGAP